MKRVNQETRVIGQNMKAMREMRGYSQREVGQVLKISFQQIQKYESGANRVPAEKLFLLQQLYEVPFSGFFDGIYPSSQSLLPHKDVAEKLMARIKSVGDTGFQDRLFRAVSALIPVE
ncbi:MAG: helix-turn-helix transcriptional regulator [Alphaproteobacteria bacterium]|nr:helix-turn-helix transcriptional regulator [Alphaproteobacteria bacterium]